MQNFRDLTTIIFDLGGVVVEINPDETLKEFSALGIELPNNQVNRYSNFGLFKAYELGDINEEDFLIELEKLSQHPIDHEVLKKAWNNTICYFPDAGLKKIKELSSQYQLVLLSNTNPSHIAYCQSLLPLNSKLEDCFTHIYYSFKIGMAKPGVEIFEYIMNDLEVNPDECLLIDDSSANIESANRLGLNTYLEHGLQSWLNLFED